MSEDSKPTKKQSKPSRKFLKITDEPSEIEVEDLECCSYCGRKATDHPDLQFIQNPSKVVYTCEVCVGSMVSVLVKGNV